MLAPMIVAFRFQLILVTCAGLALACSDFSERPCTSMGCISGVNVQIDDPEWKASPRLDIVAVADGRRIERRDCEHIPRVETKTEHTVGFSGGPCGLWIEDRGTRIQKLSVRVQWKGGAKTMEFVPQYETAYPNGPNCPGECPQAVVRIEL